MEKYWLTFLLLFGSWESQGVSIRACDNQIPVRTNYSNPLTYQTTISDSTFIVGGPLQNFAGPVDREAIKKILIYCAPGILECMKTNRVQKGFYDLTVSFELRAIGNTSMATRLQISSATLTSLGAIQCFEKVWTSPAYPLPANGVTAVQVSVPLQIR